MLTKEQEKFLKDNEDIFLPLLEQKKKLLEIENNKGFEIIHGNRLKKVPKIVDKEMLLKKKKIEHVLNKLNQRDVDRYLSILEHTQTYLLKDFKPDASSESENTDLKI